MCDQTIPYTPGTWVWAEICNRYWWPGIIVDFSSVPKEIANYRRTKKNPIAAVYFERDKSYEVVINLNKVCLYACNKKLEFLKRGFGLYMRQQKTGFSSSGIDMKNFIEDVINVERSIGGDVNIFDQFKEKIDSDEKKIPQVNINELFMTEKQRKKREKDSRRSLPSFRTPLKKSKIAGKQVSPMQSPRQNIVKMPIVPQSLVCPFCNKFSTNRYTMLKLHMNAHKNESKDDNKEETSNNKSPVTKRSSKNKKSVLSCSTSSLQVLSLTHKKRNYTRTKKTDAKGIKIQDELLKDWDDGEDLDESITGVKVLDYNSDSNESTDLNTIKTKDATQDKDTDKNEVTDPLVSKTTNEASSTRVFDFDENDDIEVHESFQNHSSLGTSSDNSVALSNAKLTSWTSVSKVIGQDDENNSVEKELQTSTQDGVNNELNDVENNLGDTSIRTENITIDINKETINNKDNCSNNDDVQLENIETEDKAYEELGNNIDNFLSKLSDDSNLESEWGKMISKTRLTKEICCSDYGKQMRTEEFPMTDKNDDNKKINESMCTVPTDVISHEPSNYVKIFLPRIPPKHTNEELVKMEAFRRLMEIADAGGDILFTIDSPIYYEQPEK